MALAAPQLSPTGRAALAYAVDFGWAVFPVHSARGGRCSCGSPACDSPGKHPRTVNGCLDASTLRDQIRGWWFKWPDANIGIATGQRSGVVVVDIDGPDGDAELRALCGNPPAPTVLTGRADGGRHAYFKAPDRPVGNKELAKKLDFRGDGGYVVAPPSQHVSGVVYRWDRDAGLGPRDLNPPPLPPAILARLAAPPALGAAEIPLQESVTEGSRNQTLARYVGRLLAKQHPAVEVLALASALNATKCRPPLADAEVEAIVQSVARAESRKRGRLALVDDRDPKPAIDAAALAEAQVGAARSWSARDFAAAPQWPWRDLRMMVGPLIPGDLWTVAARTGNGKTTFLMNWVSWLAEFTELPWLYIGMEMDAPMLRRKWAAFRQGLDEQAVLTNAWHDLPLDARERIDADLAEQLTPRYQRLAHFSPARRVTTAELGKWVGFAVDQGCKVVVVDHFHRMAFGGGVDRLQAMEETMKGAKELAVANDIVLVMAAQISRGERKDPLSAYHPPPLEGLKSCGAIEEESDAVLMLYRPLLAGIGNHALEEVRKGQAPIETVIEPNTMAVIVRKHRRNGNAVDRLVRLHIDRGLLSQATQQAPTDRIYEAPPEKVDWRTNGAGT